MPGYYDEFQKLMARLDRLERRATAASSANLPRKRTILHLLRTLQQFAQGQFRFFYEGFSTVTGANRQLSLFPELELRPSNPPRKFSPDYVLRAVLTKIEEDIDRIELAIRFRQGDPATATFLTLTDNLASAVLWPAGNGRPDGRPRMAEAKSKLKSLGEDFEVKTILTYFYDQHTPEGAPTRLPTIRILPYSQVAMIGIPEKSMQDLTLLLAIPHEIGHFRYWYSFCENWNPATNRCEAVNPRRNPREEYYDYQVRAADYPEWHEEIFSDIYALLLGGPLSLLTAQELAMAPGHNADFADFGTGDVHPTPIVRPLIQLKALEQFGTKLLANPIAVAPDRRKVVRLLRKRWKSKLRTKGYQYNLRTGVFKNTPADNTIQGRVNGVMSAGLGLAAGAGQPPVDDQVDRALRAIGAVFASFRADPRDNWGWASILGAWNDLAALEAMLDQSAPRIEDRPLYELFRRVPQMDESWIDQLDPYPFLENNRAIPPLWYDWAVTAKRYLRHDSLRRNNLIKSGTRQDMQNKTIDRWIRVFGSSGWDTRGPCAMPPG